MDYIRSLRRVIESLQAFLGINGALIVGRIILIGQQYRMGHCCVSNAVEDIVVLASRHHAFDPSVWIIGHMHKSWPCWKAGIHNYRNFLNVMIWFQEMISMVQIIVTKPKLQAFIESIYNCMLRKSVIRVCIKEEKPLDLPSIVKVG